MPSPRMHADELHTDADLVARLLAEQFPRWAGRRIEPVPSTGTVNAVYRLGNDLCVRMPRLRRAVPALEREQVWLPRLAPHLPLAVPVPLARGIPAAGYPCPWAVYRWLDGETLADGAPGDERRLAADLARFVAALRGIDPTAAPPSDRGSALAARDAPTRAAIGALRDAVPGREATDAWEAALRVPGWAGGPVWTHGDLLPANLLRAEGRLSAVIDFGIAGLGDPACDLLPAWAVLSADGRAVFRRALGVDDATWLRGRGWALSVALPIMPYYAATNPRFVTMAARMVGEVLADL